MLYKVSEIHVNAKFLPLPILWAKDERSASAFKLNQAIFGKKAFAGINTERNLLESNKQTPFQGIWLTGHKQLFFKESWEALAY